MSFIVFYLLVSRGLVIGGLTDNFAIKIVSVAGGDDKRLTIAILLSAFLLSTITTNDGAVLILVPLVLSCPCPPSGSVKSGHNSLVSD